MDTVVGHGRDPARPLTRGRSCMRQGIFVWNHDLLKINSDDETEFSVRGQPLTLHQPRKLDENGAEQFNYSSDQKPTNLPTQSKTETVFEQNNPQLEPIKVPNARSEELDMRIEFLTSVISKFRLHKRKDCLHEIDWAAPGQGQPRCVRCGRLMRTTPCLPEVYVNKAAKQTKEAVNGTKIPSGPSRLRGKLLFIRDDADLPKTSKQKKRRKTNWKKAKLGKNSSVLPPTSTRLAMSAAMSEEVENKEEMTAEDQADGLSGPRRVLVRFSSKRTIRTFVPDAPVSGPVRVEGGHAR